MAANDFGDLLTIDFAVREQDLPALAELVTPRAAAVLVERIDRMLFGKGGSFAKSIESGGRTGAAWSPLSFNYAQWKRRAMQTRQALAGEAAPNVVISTKTWVRTGKVLEFTRTTGSKGLKRVEITPENIMAGRPFYRVFIDGGKVPYWSYPNAKRQLFIFTPEDQERASSIFSQWIESLISQALRNAGLMAQ